MLSLCVSCCVVSWLTILLHSSTLLPNRRVYTCLQVTRVAATPHPPGASYTSHCKKLVTTCFKFCTTSPTSPQPSQGYWSLNHIETEDKTQPELLFAQANLKKSISTKGLNQAQLLNEVRQDKSKAAISINMSLKGWNKEGFLAKVCQGTQVPHLIHHKAKSQLPINPLSPKHQYLMVLF